MSVDGIVGSVAKTVLRYSAVLWKWRRPIKETFPNLPIVLMEFFSSFHFQGGYKLQILDHLERPSFDLTPTIAGSDFVKSDAT